MDKIKTNQIIYNNWKRMKTKMKRMMKIGKIAKSKTNKSRKTTSPLMKKTDNTKINTNLKINSTRNF
jgi:hypothetical protein